VEFHTYIGILFNFLHAVNMWVWRGPECIDNIFMLGSGTIDFTEFLAMYDQKLNGLHNENDLLGAFKVGYCINNKH